MKSQESTLQNMSHEQELLEGKRCAFGKNRLQFLKVLTEERITEADRSLCNEFVFRKL